MSCFFIFCSLTVLWLHLSADSFPQEKNKGGNEVNIGHGATVCLEFLDYAAQTVWGNVMGMSCFYWSCKEMSQLA